MLFVTTAWLRQLNTKCPGPANINSGRPRYLPPNIAASLGLKKGNRGLSAHSCGCHRTSASILITAARAVPTLMMVVTTGTNRRLR